MSRYRNFAQIPNAVIDSDISGNALKMYCLVMRLSTKNGFCWASNEHFAKKMNISISTVKRILKELKDNDFVFTKEYREGDKTTRHIFINVRIMDEPQVRIMDEPLIDTKLLRDTKTQVTLKST